MKWLIDCAELAFPPLPVLPPLAAAVPGQADVKIAENNEPLVPLAGTVRLHPVYSWLGFQHAPAVPRARAGIAGRLARASSRLPGDFELVVIDAHRDRAFQAELLGYYQAQSSQSLTQAGYVSDPYDEASVPPHVTGGAVDLTLGWRGAVLGLGTDFDAFCSRAAPAALEHPGGGIARDLRRLLASVLRAEEMVPIGTEWWHWSYGDQYWAAAAGAPAAAYGEIT